MSSLSGLINLIKKHYISIIILLTIDIIFVVLHILHSLPFFEEIVPSVQNVIFSIAHDNGLAEFWQYIKGIAAVVGLTILTVKRDKYYGIWGGLLLYITLDDMFKIHETLGGMIVKIISFPHLDFLRVKDFGELVVYLVIGLIFITALFLNYKNLPTQTRTVFSHFWVFFALFIFFGMVLDFAAVAAYKITNSEMIAGCLELIEDGGEMIALSGLLWSIYWSSDLRKSLNF